MLMAPLNLIYSTSVVNKFYCWWKCQALSEGVWAFFFLWNCKTGTFGWVFSACSFIYIKTCIQSLKNTKLFLSELSLSLNWTEVVLTLDMWTTCPLRPFRWTAGIIVMKWEPAPFIQRWASFPNVDSSSWPFWKMIISGNVFYGVWERQGLAVT